MSVLIDMLPNKGKTSIHLVDRVGINNLVQYPKMSSAEEGPKREDAHRCFDISSFTFFGMPLGEIVRGNISSSILC